MLSETILRHLTNQIHAASQERSGWGTAIEKLCGCFGANMGTIYSQHLVTNETHGNIDVSMGLDPKYLQSYKERFSKQNVFLARTSQEELGRAQANQDVLSDRQLLKTEFFNDWLDPQNFRYGLSAVLAKDRFLTSVIVFTRTPDAGEFEREDVLSLQELILPLQLAVRSQQRFDTSQKMRKISEDVLNLSPFGFILLNSKCQVLHKNKTGQELVEGEDGIRIVNQRVSATSPKKAAQLSALIEAATRPCRLENYQPVGGAIALDRPHPKQPLHAFVTTLFLQHGTFLPAEVGVGIFLSDPEQKRVPPLEAVRTLFDVTPTEARVASLVAQGYSTEDVCREVDIKETTFKTHLKHIFGATETHWRGELMQLLNDMPVKINDMSLTRLIYPERRRQRNPLYKEAHDSKL